MPSQMLWGLCVVGFMEKQKMETKWNSIGNENKTRTNHWCSVSFMDSWVLCFVIILVFYLVIILWLFYCALWLLIQRDCQAWKGCCDRTHPHNHQTQRDTCMQCPTVQLVECHGFCSHSSVVISSTSTLFASSWDFSFDPSTPHVQFTAHNNSSMPFFGQWFIAGVTSSHSLLYSGNTMEAVQIFNESN